MEKAAKIGPNNGEIYFWMARAYRRKGQLDEVRRCLISAHKLGFSTARLQREGWLAMAQAGEMREADRHFSALMVDPQDDGAEICEAYANGYLRAYRYADAFAVVDAWEKDFPNDSQPHFFRGLVANTRSSWQSAAKHFQRALELEPGRDDVRLQLAKTLLTLKQTAQAATEFRQLLKSSPADPAVQVGWGQTLLEQGELDAARAVFTDVLKARPNHVETLLAFGQVELSDQRFADAIRLLEKAVELDPDDPETHNALANAYQRSDRPADARSQFEKAVQIRENLSRIQALEDHLTRHPKDIEARFEVAMLLRDKRNPLDRLNWLQSIIELDPQHQRAHAELAEYYESIGDSKLASHHRAAGNHRPDKSEEKPAP